MRQCENDAHSEVECKYYKSCAMSTVFFPIDSFLNPPFNHSRLTPHQNQKQTKTSFNYISKCTSLVSSSPSAFWPPPPSLAPPASGAAATRTVSRALTVPSTSATRLATGSCPPSAPAGPAARSTATTPTPTVSANSVRYILSLNHGLSGRYHPLSRASHSRKTRMSFKWLKLTSLYHCRRVA